MSILITLFRHDTMSRHVKRISIYSYRLLLLTSSYISSGKGIYGTKRKNRVRETYLTRKALWQSRKETVELAEAGKFLGARRVGARRVWKIPKISVEEYIENDLRSAQERIV